MERNGHQQTTLNTVCPVCGAPIDPEAPPVNLSDERRPRVLRVCSAGCGDLAIVDAERYLAAAAENRPAHHPDDRPLPYDGSGA